MKYAELGHEKILVMRIMLPCDMFKKIHNKTRYAAKICGIRPHERYKE